MKQLRLYKEPKLPDFEQTGVNPDNAEEWRQLIALKNPWLERKKNETSTTY